MSRSYLMSCPDDGRRVANGIYNYPLRETDGVGQRQKFQEKTET